MDMQGKSDSGLNIPDPQSVNESPPSLLKAPLNSETIKRFFQVTGGSSLYCLRDC